MHRLRLMDIASYDCHGPIYIVGTVWCSVLMCAK